MMDPYERHNNTMNEMMGDVSYLNVIKKGKIHVFQCKILWVKFLEVARIVRVRKDLFF